MINPLSISDWIDVIRKEYLDGFVRDGGASIKFAVPANEELIPLLHDAFTRMASNLGYIVAHVDAGETRVHMAQDVFFRIADQIDWRLLARRVVVRLWRDTTAYQTDMVDPLSDTPVLEAISTANAVEESHIALRLDRVLPGAVTQNRNMSRDFRVAMTHLCLTEMGGYGQNQEEAPLIEWLTGRSRRVSNVRAYQIYNSIARTNARHFLESLLYWVRFAGFPGTVVLFNDSRLTLRSNPRDGLRFYSRAAAMDHYELLRELIDGTDRLEGLFVLVTATEDFLDDDPRSKGFSIYQALRGRIADEVWDRSQANPMSTLVRLADTAQ